MCLKGFGIVLFVDGEVKIWKCGVDIIWCNVWIVVVGFYEKYGYCKVGKLFVIFGIGEYYLMKKVNLNKKVDYDN